MSFLPDLPAQIYEFAAAVKAALNGLFHKAEAEAAKLYRWGQLIVDRLAEKLPPGKQRRILIALTGGGTIVALIIFGTLLAARGKSEERKTPPSGAAAAQQRLIPPEELFLPGEPDFIPGVIPEREQRTQWTADDAAPFWQDPLKNGEELWRDQIERAIDEIMESVP